MFSFVVFTGLVCCRHSYLSCKPSNRKISHASVCVCKEEGICKEVFEICFKVQPAHPVGYGEVQQDLGLEANIAQLC